METLKSLGRDDAGRAQPFLGSSESLCVGDGVCTRVGAGWVHSPAVPSTGISFPWDVGPHPASLGTAVFLQWRGLRGLEEALLPRPSHDLRAAAALCYSNSGFMAGTCLK